MKNATHHSTVRIILAWYARHGRTLPWRMTANSYRILVSEVMLQQTQVSRVLLKYPEFLHRFPTMTALARARRRSVIVAWRGMGYNNRAVRLHELAQIVRREFNARLPAEFAKLQSLPGIGRYTANAILSSAFHEDVPVVDVNVQRFLSRLFWKMPDVGAVRPANEIWSLAAALLPRGRAYRWNQALMDLGATVCTARSPRCPDCPVASRCMSRSSMKRWTASERSKQEPSRNGIPHRIYRGRIVERLRSLGNGHAISIHRLGTHVVPDYSRKDERWLASLLEGLAQDGLVKMVRRTNARGPQVTLR